MNKSVVFQGTTYTESSLFKMGGKELVLLHNDVAKKLGNWPTTNRFSSVGNGVERTWKLLVEFASKVVGEVAPAPKVAPPIASMGTPVAEKKSVPSVPRRRGTNLLPTGDKVRPCRENSKQSVLVDLLRRPAGATMADLVEGLSGGNRPWQEVTVRAGFGWDLKQKGYGVRSEFKDDGTEVFYLVLPKGGVIPPHTPLKGAAKADVRQAKLKV